MVAHKPVTEAELAEASSLVVSVDLRKGVTVEELLFFVSKTAPRLIAEVRRLRKALTLVLAEADNDKCNEMDSLITCVNLAEEALK